MTVCGGVEPRLGFLAWTKCPPEARALSSCACSRLWLKRSLMQGCGWAATEPNTSYHDKEWGVPVHEDRLLFEFLILEGAQAGLSWSTILNKRQNYRKAFDDFDARKIARYGPTKVKKLM